MNDYEELSHALDELGSALADAFLPMFEGLVDALNPFAKVLNELASDLIELIIGSTRELQALRQTDESILAWGKRLEALGLLDNPEIRWQYQKACLLWVASPVIWIGTKIFPPTVYYLTYSDRPEIDASRDGFEIYDSLDIAQEGCPNDRFGFISCYHPESIPEDADHWWHHPLTGWTEGDL